MQVCATLTAATDTATAFTVTLATSDGTGTYGDNLPIAGPIVIMPIVLIAAIAGSDYVSVSMMVVFPSANSSGAMQCVDVSITDDSAMEKDETFTVSLTTSSPTLGNAETIITITDTDGE